MRWGWWPVSRAASSPGRGCGSRPGKRRDEPRQRALVAAAGAAAGGLRLPALRPGGEPRAVVGGGGLVLAEPAAVPVRLPLLGARVPPAGAGDGEPLAVHLDRGADDAA